MPRRYYLVRGIIAAFLLLLLDSGAFAKGWTGKVTGVVDGNTFTAIRGGTSEERVQLLGVDAPKAGQPYGAEAKQLLSSLILGRTVYVDEAPPAADRAGCIGWVRVWDDLKTLDKDSPLQRTEGDVNRAVVAAGLGWWRHQDFRNPLGQLSRDLAQAEVNARAERKGLW